VKQTDRGRDDSAVVIVVGGGVSGCACAATLAAGGNHVIVVSKALDTVGLLAYGPDLHSHRQAPGRLREVLDSLPSPLREVWLNAAAVAEPDCSCGTGGRARGSIDSVASAPAELLWTSGAVFLNVDRRVLSVETKRVLETMRGLQFRQGLVDDLRVETEGVAEAEHSVAVETAFGEVLRADAVVLAVGMSMGGEVAIGEDRLLGGRYGEMPSNGLLEALLRLGVELEEVKIEVGPRFAGGQKPFAWPYEARPESPETPEKPTAEGPSPSEERANRCYSQGLVLAGESGFPACAEDDLIPVIFQPMLGECDTGVGGADSVPGETGNGVMRESSREDGSGSDRQRPGRYCRWGPDYPPAPYHEPDLRLWRGLAVQVTRCEAAGRSTDRETAESVAAQGEERSQVGASAAVHPAQDGMGPDGTLLSEDGVPPEDGAPPVRVLSPGSLELPQSVESPGSVAPCATAVAASVDSTTAWASVVPWVAGGGVVAVGGSLAAPIEEPVRSEKSSEQQNGVGLVLSPAVSPDSLVTGELYVTCEADLARRGGGGGSSGSDDGVRGDRGAETASLPGYGAMGEPASRLGYRVRGQAVRSMGDDGRVLAGGKPIGPVWVAGRAAGAEDYVESLASGVRVAGSVIAYLRARSGS